MRMNAAPPFSPARYENRHTLPSPIAEPTVARRKPRLDDQFICGIQAGWRASMSSFSEPSGRSVQLRRPSIPLVHRSRASWPPFGSMPVPDYALDSREYGMGALREPQPELVNG